MQVEACALTVTLATGLQQRWRHVLETWRGVLHGLREPLDQLGYESRRVTARRPVDRPGSLPLSGIHPRRFELRGGWTVLVGRSNRENDLLTHRIARPRDLWLHARGVTGSHVILRREDHKDAPSKQTIEQAAAIAAYFSKARTSALVPVIYVEKRYVRKPRKAPPGLAVCIREEVLMVEPRLPKPATGDRP